MENLGNDYAQHFVETRERPQNFISDGSLDAQFQGYPKLDELVRRKADIIQHTATPPMQLRADLHTLDLTLLGRHFFDVIVVDPDWSHIDDDSSDTMGGAESQRWTFNQLADLRIPDIAASPSFVFLWAGNGRGLDLGRKLLVKWGYRRCEDIVWVKTNKHSLAPNALEPKAVLEHTKEHCLMGIRGTARRSTDSHFIHCNVDTDVIVAEESPPGTRRKPVELFHIIEHFCLGRRRLCLFGDTHCVRPGWVTVGPYLNTTDFDIDTYRSFFAEPIGHLVPQDPGKFTD
ncbi:N6-adenosine-methyltransferase subunit mettl14 [Dimargaris xerosporica]|nr:N6-adenosine-methyltransferase subunit mettl14 [Dimargaris xerosporica]